MKWKENLWHLEIPMNWQGDHGADIQKNGLDVCKLSKSCALSIGMSSECLAISDRVETWSLHISTHPGPSCTRQGLLIVHLTQQNLVFVISTKRDSSKLQSDHHRAYRRTARHLGIGRSY